MKKSVILLLFVVLVINIIYAQQAEHITKGAKWLANNSDWNSDIENVVFSSIALDLAGEESKAQTGITRLIDRKDSLNCWPKGACKVKDTALGLLAVAHFKKETNGIVKWLNEAEIPGLRGGKWWIQIAASGDGQCKTIYDGKEKRFTIKSGKIVECSNQDWLDVNCIEPNFASKSVRREVTVDCSGLASNAIISLIYQMENKFFIVQEEHSSVAKLFIKNSCFGATKGSTTCDYYSSLYAGWALSNLDKDVNSLVYLQSDLRANDPLANALLYLITKKSAYEDALKNQQSSAGNWGNVYTTAFGNLALRGTSEADNATAWLKFQQQLDGSWNRNMRDTSVVIYSFLATKEEAVTQTGCSVSGYRCCDDCSNDAIHYEALDYSCSTGQVCCDKCTSSVAIQTCSEINGQICSYDEECTGLLEEAADSSFCCVDGECKVKEETTTTLMEEVCDNDGECDEFEGEDIISCPSDCEPKKKSSAIWWILLIVLIIVLLAVLWFVKKKKGGFSGIRLFKRGEKPKYEVRQRPAYPVQPGVQRPMQRQMPPQMQRPIQQMPPRELPKSKLDEELEKSLEEAKKLLKESKKKK